MLDKLYKLVIKLIGSKECLGFALTCILSPFSFWTQIVGI